MSIFRPRRGFFTLISAVLDKPEESPQRRLVEKDFMIDAEPARRPQPDLIAVERRIESVSEIFFTLAHSDIPRARIFSHAGSAAPNSSSLPRATRASWSSLASAGTRTAYRT